MSADRHGALRRSRPMRFQSAPPTGVRGDTAIISNKIRSPHQGIWHMNAASG